RAGRWAAGRRRRSFRLRARGLEVGDDVEDLRLAHLAREARHDRVVARHHVALRKQDRVADVRLVGDEGASVLEVHDAMPDAVEIRRMELSARIVAAAAAEAAEGLEAARG